MQNLNANPFKKTLIILLKIGSFLFVLGLVLLLWTKYIIHKEKYIFITKFSGNNEKTAVHNEPFPVGVDPINKTIVENPNVDWYMESQLSIAVDTSHHQRLFDRLVSQLSKWTVYQHLASPSSRVLVIYPGERKEEVAKNFGDILRWNKADREEFTALVVEAEPFLEEGKFFPGRYVTNSKATPEEVFALLNDRFISEIVNKYSTDIAKKISLKETLIIASLLEREAYNFTDMRYISGIIWNRLFIDMPLQLDASLQYVRGSQANEPKWWPAARPADKFLDSPYNTYENSGLPPAPIANPSIEAVVAALNPKITDCIFYFHDPKGSFYCTTTYEDHVAKLKAIYGQGQ